MVKTKEISISEIGNIFTGNTPPRKNPEYYGNHTLFIKPTDISKETKYTYTPEECYSKLAYEKYKNSLVPKGATCVVTIGSIGEKLTKAHKECFINQAMNAVVPNENFDEDYVYYLLKFNLRQLKMFDSGTASGRENVSKSAFSNIRVIALTSKDEQIKVGKLLSNYDDLIENNNRRIKILEEMAQKIYKEWFVDFKFPGHENTTFKDSPLGKIPNDWKVGIIKDINDVKGGYAFKSKDLKENGKFGIIKIKNIQVGNIDTNMCQYIDEKLAQKASDFKLNAGDILIAMTGAQVGKVGIMPQTKQVYYLNQRVAKFIPNKDFIINNQYLAIYTQTEKFNIQINNIASGAAQPNISASQIENIEILVPKAEIISAFENFINPNLKEAQILKNKNENLKHTRDILLPRLISGEINVENMEVL